MTATHDAATIKAVLVHPSSGDYYLKIACHSVGNVIKDHIVNADDLPGWVASAFPALRTRDRSDVLAALMEQAHSMKADAALVTQTGWATFGDNTSFVLRGPLPGIAHPTTAVVNSARMYLDQHGTMEEWGRALEAAKPYPRVLLALYAACAPPILRLLDAPNFMVQWQGPGSSGKSTCVALAASVWGNPDRTADACFVKPWGREVEVILHDAYTLSQVPVCLDDQLTAKETAKRMRPLLYGESEHGKFHTVVISAGLESLEMDTAPQSEGLVSRSLNLWGSPFGKQTPETAKAVNAIWLAIAQNYGWFGPELIRRLNKAKALWPKWKEVYRSRVGEYAVIAAQHGGMAAATSRHIATLATVGDIVHGLFPELGFTHKETVDDLWVWLSLNPNRDDETVVAHGLLSQFIARHQDRIIGLRDKKLGPPLGGWYGATDMQDRVWITQSLAESFLKSSGCKEPRAIFTAWRDAGLCVNVQGRFYKKVRVGRVSVACISLREPKQTPC